MTGRTETANVPIGSPLIAIAVTAVAVNPAGGDVLSARMVTVDYPTMPTRTETELTRR
ncbi:hypothetical protein [Actinoplanes sp. NPDC026623]|uniref:hypothetical protein n=1 Tax=Actinoplanes sp. NPDC026623 TaxID=3155610 RepID=UPI0033CA2E82